MPYLKTTFILGAGASRHTGGPLMFDFLPRAMRLMDEIEQANPDLYRLLDHVFEYQAQNDALESLLACNFTNIEDLFGLLDLEARVQPAARKTRMALVQLILHTLETSIK